MQYAGLLSENIEKGEGVIFCICVYFKNCGVRVWTRHFFLCKFSHWRSWCWGWCVGVIQVIVLCFALRNVALGGWWWWRVVARYKSLFCTLVWRCLMMCCLVLVCVALLCYLMCCAELLFLISFAYELVSMYCVTLLCYPLLGSLSLCCMKTIILVMERICSPLCFFGLFSFVFC